jgi:hypothetical protein
MLDERNEFLFTHEANTQAVKRFEWDRGLLGTVCVNGKAIRIDSCTTDPRFNALVDSYIEALTMKGMIIVPIIDMTSHKPYGIVYLIRRVCGIQQERWHI